MQNKILLLLLAAVFVAIVGIAWYVLFPSEDGDEGLLDRAEVETATDERTEIDTQKRSESAGREKLVPSPVDLVTGSDTMPASYREALGILKGRILEQDGTPVPGLKVELYGMGLIDFFLDGSAFIGDDPPQLDLRAAGTETDEDGKFMINDVFPQAFYALCMDAGGPRPASRILDHVPNPGQTVDLGDIVLDPYAILTGVVVDEEGEPVGGVRVRATQLPPVIFISGMQDYRDDCSFLVRFDETPRVIDPPPVFKRFASLMPFPTTLTESDGAFRLEGVPLGRLTVVVDRIGYVTNKKGPVSTMDGGEKDLGKIEIGEGIALEGKIVDSFGDPAEGIEVRVGPTQGIAEFVVLQPPAVSDSEGKFTFEGASPLATFAAARRFPEDPWTVVGPFDPELEPPTLTLPPAYDLRLRIYGGEGALVEDARVKMRQQQEFFMAFLPLHPPITPTGRMERPEEGVIDIMGLPPGSYELLVSAPGYGVKKENVTIKAEPAQKDITLEPAFLATVRVLSEKKKIPIEWAEVFAYEDEKALFSNPTKMARVRTNAAGQALFKTLGAGEYKLSISHPSYALTNGTLVIPAAEEVVVTLLPGGILEGIVHKGGATHEAPYMLALNLDESSTGLKGAVPRVSATDHEGKFRVTNLEPGTWDVSVLKRVLDEDPLGLTNALRLGPLMSEEVEIWSEETTKVEFNLGAEETGPSARVSGRVFVDGRPAQGALISSWAKRRREAIVDSVGQYDLGQVPAGNRTIRIATLPGKTGQYDFSLSRRVEVVENVPSTVTFEIFTGTISGKVLCESDPGAARSVRISARLEDEEVDFSVRMSTVTGLDGSFVFEGVPVGRYTIRARDNEFRCPPARDVEVFSGSTTGGVTLAMVTPVLVSGVVKLPPELVGKRWMGLYFESTEKGGSGGEWISIGKETGNFETRKLIPGSYKAQLLGDFDGVSYEPFQVTVPAAGLNGLVLVPKKNEPNEQKDPKK